MKNTDVQKIRQKLSEVLARLHLLYEYDVRADLLVREALALLPCETCGGTKQVPTPQSIGFGEQNEILEPCPDCQQNEGIKNVPHPNSHTKGKLEYSVLDGTNTPATLFIKPDDGIDVDIAVFEKWEQDWAKEEMIAYAKKLLRCWAEAARRVIRVNNRYIQRKRNED